MIKPIEELKNDGLVGLIYGKAGVGKTLFVAGAALVDELSPVLIINTDKGLKTLDNSLYRGKIDYKDAESYDAARKITDAVAAKKEGYSKYKTVIIDSYTALSKWELHAIAVAAGRGDKQNQLQDYQLLSNRLSVLIRQLRSLGLTVLLTAGQKITFASPEEEEAGRFRSIEPDFTKRLREIIEHAVDFVWYNTLRPDGSLVSTIIPKFTTWGGEIFAKTRGENLRKSLEKYQYSKEQGTVLIGNIYKPEISQFSFEDLYTVYKGTHNG